MKGSVNMSVLFAVKLAVLVTSLVVIGIMCISITMGVSELDEEFEKKYNETHFQKG